jgi:signal transduction histidine kinase
VRQLSLLAQQGQVDFVDAIGDDLPFIAADRRALRQVLYNLLSNAIKFTPPGGRVTLSAAPVPNGVEVIVEDTGIGMPKEALPRLGNPFEQVANGYSRVHGGAGLGLAITKKLIGLQSGVMTFDSELGVGSVFRVAFRCASTLAKAS